MRRNTGALLEVILGTLLGRPEALEADNEPEQPEGLLEPNVQVNDEPETEKVEIPEETEEKVEERIDEKIDEKIEGPSAEWIGRGRKPDNREIQHKLNLILGLLTNPCFGLCEIKREVREIEDNMGNGDNVISGPITTGPFFVRAGQNNAINVLVQNLEEGNIDVEVKLINLEACPPFAQGNVSIEDFESCCTEQVGFTVPAGNWEVVVCPTPETARVRAFVSVHGGNAVTSAFEYVIRASEMLPAACSFCDLVVP